MALGIAILSIVLVAALPTNTGAVPADTSCQYASCQSTSSTSTPVAWYALLGVLVLIAVALGLVLLMRRRRSGGGARAVEPWSGAGGPESGAVAEAAPAMGADAMAGPEYAPSVPPGAGAAYTENPEDVGAAAAEGGAMAAPAEGEADIDSLMQELDKISGEILKRGTPDKKTGASPPPEDDEGTTD